MSSSRSLILASVLLAIATLAAAPTFLANAPKRRILGVGPFQRSIDPYPHEGDGKANRYAAVQETSLNTRLNPDGLGKIEAREKGRIPAHRSRAFL